MGWGIKLNTTQLLAAKRALIVWLGFVSFGLVMGAGLNPRPDEIVFMVLLPVPLLILYALASLAVGMLRLLWPVWRYDGWLPLARRRLLAQSHQRVGYRGR
jgi:hypothetical protein